MLPGLIKNEKKYLLGINKDNAKIVYKPITGEKEYYDSFEGILKNIIKRETTINNKPAIYYDLIMENSGNIYNFSVTYNGSPARSIILSIASVEDIKGKYIKISPYLSKNGYLNVSVYINGERSSWVVPKEQIPPVKKVVYGSKEIDDDSDRIAMVDSYVNLINQRLRKIVDEETGETFDPEEVADDLPEELG